MFCCRTSAKNPDLSVLKRPLFKQSCCFLLKNLIQNHATADPADQMTQEIFILTSVFCSAPMSTITVIKVFDRTFTNIMKWV